MKKSIIIIIVVLIIGVFLFLRNGESEDIRITGENFNQERTVEVEEQPEEYGGEKGERVSLENGKIEIDVSDYDNQAQFYNVEMPSGKFVYFFVIQDRNGIFRAAANEYEICYAARTGFRHEEDVMVCNNCGNRYPAEKIAEEKGGCNPAPINPNLEVSDGYVVIEEKELNQVERYF